MAAAEPAEPAQAAPFTAEALAFFEKDVKPILTANCIHCHGAEKKVQSGLHLTSRAGVLQGGENGPAVNLQKPEESPLLAAINYESFEMPPKGKLPQAQIEVLTRWVKMGLPWPEGKSAGQVHGGPPVVDDAARNFWSFRPVARPAVPVVKDQAWVRNPIDAFMLASLEEKGLRPAPPADDATLLRRATYAVTGLPPGPADVEEFLQSETAYSALVDRLLASRHFGEHWGRHWLDLVRYAETNSFERDNPKPFVWRYRDYVVRSLNGDKPYDQFIREQLAGDELEPVTPETIIATGYYRLGLWDDEPADPLLAYYDGLDDILATTGQAFLGLSVNCARCHDHKIDPFPQRDYYGLLAFLHGIRHYGERSDESVAAASLRSIATAAEAEKFKSIVTEYELHVADLEAQLAAIEAPIEQKLPGGERDDFKYPKNRVSILRKYVGELLSAQQFDEYQQLRKDLDGLQRERPRAAEQALVVKEHSKPQETFILLRGNPLSKGERVEPSLPSVLSAATGEQASRLPRQAENLPYETSGRRRALAEWIASPQNPLTSRVMANRIWQYAMGRGIVRSASNFGYQGTPPTHPELLDWLASEFVAGGMRIKPLLRLILTSNAFRMSGQIDPAAARIDPENDLLSHFDLRRLSAEEIRDSILAVCGNLHLDKQEGPSVYPRIPAEVHAGQSKPGYGWPTTRGPEANARSLFVHSKRSLPLPILAAFDAPDPDAPCPVRFATTQPTQALGMLNSQFVNEQARIFAEAAVAAAGADAEGQVRYVLWRVIQRAPTAQEINRGAAFLAEAQRTEEISSQEALRQFCLLALNLNEFVYVE